MQYLTFFKEKEALPKVQIVFDFTPARRARRRRRAILARRPGGVVDARELPASQRVVDEFHKARFNLTRAARPVEFRQKGHQFHRTTLGELRQGYCGVVKDKCTWAANRTDCEADHCVMSEPVSYTHLTLPTILRV